MRGAALPGGGGTGSSGGSGGRCRLLSPGVVAAVLVVKPGAVSLVGWVLFCRCWLLLGFLFCSSVSSGAGRATPVRSSVGWAAVSGEGP